MVALPEAVTTVLDAAIEQVYSLAPLVEPTVCLVPPFVEEGVQSLADSIGFDIETLKYVLGMFLCYPLGIIMNQLPYGKTRHFFSFLLGAFVIQFVIGVQWMHHLITSLAAYLMFMVLPRSTSKLAVPVFVMVYMTLGHLHRQYVSYLGWDLDFTGTQMVLTQKLYMMAYNLYDGHVNKIGKSNKASTKCAPFALEELPGLLEYLGYCFCFSTLLAGPAYEFSVYNNAAEGTLLYKDGKPRGKIPSTIVPTLIPFVKSLINMAVFVVGSASFSILDQENAQLNTPNTLKPDFLEKPWIQRYAYMWLALVIVRQKYYFAWNNAEGANNLWYAGFEGFDEKTGEAKGWSNANNMDMWKFETAPNVQALSREWNKRTSLWLNRYVYIRTNGSLVAVYSLSAFWHGFYPGYYLFFLSVPLMTMCERLGKKKISPYFSKEKWSLYGLVCIIATSICIQYMVSAFILLAFDRSWGNWKSHYFFGHIGLVIFHLIVSRFPTPKKKEKTV